MKGYFKINFRLFALLLVIVLAYVFYLYSFEQQSPAPYYKRVDCTDRNKEEGSQKANAYFDAYFDRQVARSPEWQTYLGIKTNYDEWTPMDEAFEEGTKAMAEEALVYLQDSILSCLCLDKQTQISAHLFKGKLELAVQKYDYRHYNYPVHQMRGVHTQLPSFLINMHLIKDERDAKAYITRVKGAASQIDQLIDQLKIRAEKKIILPKFLFPKVLETIANIKDISTPEKHSLYQDFETKIKEVTALEETRKIALKKELKIALVEYWTPAYERLYAYLTVLEKEATDDAGVWKFEKGTAFYQLALAEQTTTTLSADEIFELGAEEVARIHQEMETIIKSVNFEGSRAEFFEFMRTDKQFYYSNDTKGKEAYMAAARAIIDSMRLRLDALFITQPKAALIVKRVEAFREKSAGKAFYQSPAPDGSRPGTYYANTYDMTQMPNYQMEALAYHEAIPGHHMQLSIAQELEGLPKFRRLDARYTAYIEGWGLYSEFLPKELGFYSNPYSDFGRLAMELWRACRLVADVGIHHKKWTRQKAIDYYKKNTPNAAADCVKMVERHMVMPAQATTYKIGMITLLELRAKAKKALGDKFDIRKFHEVVLTNGALPLEVLQDLVEEYIQKELG